MNDSKVSEDAAHLHYTDVTECKEDENRADERPVRQDENDAVMSGTPLAMFSVGMMAVVFLMCLDHYILGKLKP